MSADPSTSLGQSHELKTILQLAKNLPLMKLPDGTIHVEDSSNEEQKNIPKHILLFHHEHRQTLSNRLQQEWKNLQSNIPVWFLLLIVLSLSALLWCKFNNIPSLHEYFLSFI